MWFLWPGVRLWYLPGSPNDSNTSTMRFSNLILSSLFMEGGRFHPLTFLATLALMETSSSRGSILVSTYSPTGMLQSWDCLVWPSILWYSRMSGSKQKLNTSQSSGRVAQAPTELSSLQRPPIMMSSRRCWSSLGRVRAFLPTSSVKYLLARLTLTLASYFQRAQTLLQSTFPSPSKNSFLAFSLNTILPEDPPINLLKVINNNLAQVFLFKVQLYHRRFSQIMAYLYKVLLSSCQNPMESFFYNVSRNKNLFFKSNMLYGVQFNRQTPNPIRVFELGDNFQNKFMQAPRRIFIVAHSYGKYKNFDGKIIGNKVAINLIKN